jgi:hypothetical protein
MTPGDRKPRPLVDLLQRQCGQRRERRPGLYERPLGQHAAQDFGGESGDPGFHHVVAWHDPRAVEIVRQFADGLFTIDFGRGEQGSAGKLFVLVV